MKKTLLASLLVLAFSGSANAALVSVTKDGSFNNGNSGSISFAGGSVDQFFEMLTVGTDPLDKSVLTLTLTNPGTPMVFELYVNLANTTDAFVTYDDTKLLFTRIVSSTNPTVAVNAVPGNWVLKLNSATPPYSTSVGSVPVPAAAWLFGSALFGAGALRRKQKTA